MTGGGVGKGAAGFVDGEFKRSKDSSVHSIDLKCDMLRLNF